MSNQPEKKGVSAVDFFCIGFGAIVGVGWAVSINSWMTSCGGPIPAGIGYILALVMMVPIALCYCELVPMLPVAGGGMAFAYRAFNETVSFISGWAAFGAFVSIIPWEAIQITDVLGYLIPNIKAGDPLYQIAGTDVYLVTIIIGTICSLLLFALNMRGLAAAATLQKVLCFVLVGAGIVGAIASLVGGNASNWQPIYEVTDPSIYGPASEGLKEVSHSSMFGGMMAILASAPFFLAGFETIPQGVEDAGGDITSFSAAAFVLSWTITSYSLIRLRKTEPDLPRPYKIVGGTPTAWFGGIVMTVIWVMFFIPTSPCYMGTMAMIIFLVWMAIGIILYLGNSGQRRKVPKEERAAAMFATMGDE